MVEEKELDIEEENEEKQTVPKSGFFARLRAYLFTGMLVTAPIAVTFSLASFLFKFVDNNVVKFIPQKYNPETYLPFAIPGLGLVVLLVSLILIGAFAAGFMGRLILKYWERLLDKMPIISSVYGTTKQIIETVMAQSSSAFRQVVLVEYPRQGIWAIGFITGRTKGEVQNLISQEVVNVFLPTTPNPTSGFLLFVPRKDMVVLNMTVEEGIKMVISGGIVVPPDKRPLSEQNTPVLDANTKPGIRLDTTVEKLEEAPDMSAKKQLTEMFSKPVTEEEKNSEPPGAPDILSGFDKNKPD